MKTSQIPVEIIPTYFFMYPEKDLDYFSVFRQLVPSHVFDFEEQYFVIESKQNVISI